MRLLEAELFELWFRIEVIDLDHVDTVELWKVYELVTAMVIALTWQAFLIICKRLLDNQMLVLRNFDVFYTCIHLTILSNIVLVTYAQYFKHKLCFHIPYKFDH